MRASPSKTGYYVLEGLNSFATAYFFNYLLFLLRDAFGFTNLETLAVGALHGLVYIPASLYGGKFGQRHGAFLSLRIGFGGLALAVAIAWAWSSLTGQMVGLALWTITICFTWPILEGLVSEHESPQRLPHRVGLYNVIWAALAALGFSTGGWIFQHLGHASLYWLPLAIHGVQFLATWPLQKRHDAWLATAPPVEAMVVAPDPEHRPAYFQRLAWLGNPFNYMAINTVAVLSPGLANRLGLTLAQAGVVLSVWFYVRAFAFLKLWLWPGWHYRFGWFFGAFVMLLVSFVALVLSHHVVLTVLAQVGLGWASALIYYSSLYYAMDGSDTHSEHGGIHEALIGVGICGGPAVSAGALWLTGSAFAPAGAVAVALFIAIGVSWRIHHGATQSSERLKSSTR